MSSPPPRALTVAAALVAAEGVAALAYAGYLLVETVRGDPDSVANALGTAGFMATCAGLLWVVARGLVRRGGWARSPAVVAQLLLLAVAVPLAQGGQAPVGVPLAAAAVGALVLLMLPGTGAALGR